MIYTLVLDERISQEYGENVDLEKERRAIKETEIGKEIKGRSKFFNISETETKHLSNRK